MARKFDKERAIELQKNHSVNTTSHPYFVIGFFTIRACYVVECVRFVVRCMVTWCVITNDMFYSVYNNNPCLPFLCLSMKFLLLTFSLYSH